MLTHENLNKVLEELSRDNNARHLLRNHAILGEVIHSAFPAGSALAAAYEALGKRMVDARAGAGDSDAEQPRMIVEVQELAKAASTLLQEFGPSYAEAASNNNEREVEHLVNQVFYKSQPYNFAKWILIISLVIVGAGSASFAGFTLSIWDRINEAQQKLQEMDKTYNNATTKFANEVNDLTTKQNAALEGMQKALQKAVAEKNEQYDAMLKAELKKTTDAFDIDTTAAGTVIDQQKTKIISDVTGTDGFFDEQKKSVGTAAVAASGSIDKQTKDFATGLDLALEQAKAKIDPAIAEQMTVIGKAAENGSQKINTEVQSSVDQAKAQLDAVSDRDTTTLHDALNAKLTALDGKSNEAAKSIDVVVAAVAAQETDFANGMKSRLSNWDQQTAAAMNRVDAVEKSVTAIKSGTNELDARLAALQKSATAALDVASELSAGTATGDLQHIGAILEIRAGLILLSLVLAGISILLSAGIAIFLLCQARHRQHGLPEAVQ
jgi:hypothetical protein